MYRQKGRGVDMPLYPLRTPRVSGSRVWRFSMVCAQLVAEELGDETTSVYTLPDPQRRKHRSVTAVPK